MSGLELGVSALDDVDMSALNDQGQCIPGEAIGLCTICGDDLNPTQALSDPKCPELSCESKTAYQVINIELEGRACLQYTSSPPLHNCKSMGVCHEDPEEACTFSPEPNVIATSFPGCSNFLGCEGATGPEFAANAAPGDKCHGFGECLDNGSCSVPERCGGPRPDYVIKYCADESTEINNLEGCDLLIDIGNVANADEISCTIACATSGGCLDAWRASEPQGVEDECSYGSQIQCSTRARRLICRCALR